MQKLLSQIPFVQLQIFCYDQAWSLWDKPHTPAQLLDRLSQPPYREKVLAWAQCYYAQLYQEYLQRQDTMHLPNKSYQYFVGRKADLQLLIGLLRHKQQPVIAVIGMGGMGKTSLARELIDGCLRQKLFQGVAWTSAKQQQFKAEEIKTEAPTVDLNTVAAVFDHIARQLGQPDITRLALPEKQAALQQLLRAQRYLLIMDNLETVGEAEALVDMLAQCLGQSQLLITSRHQLKLDAVYHHGLSGLDPQAALEFIRLEAKQRNIRAVLQADDKTLTQIAEATGNAPLAMKLVLGQLHRLPLAVVLRQLKEVKGQDKPLYEFIYRHSWDMLSEEAKGVLVDLTVLPPMTGGGVAEVENICNIPPDDFWAAIGQLVEFCLVEYLPEPLQSRYALHALTHYFVLSNITQDWDEARLY